MSSLMYVTLNANTKQFRVKEGDIIVSNRLKNETGSTITFDDVIFAESDDGEIIIGDSLKNISVVATVVSHPLGKKLRIFKMRRRKASRRTQGHRQSLTELRIEKIQDNS